MQHADAVNVIKALRRKGQVEYIRLEDCGLAIRQIACRNLRSPAQVDAHYVCSPAGGDFSEASHTAAHIEHESSREIFRTKTRPPAEGVFGAATVFAIQLCLRINLPLKTKATRVVLRVHEAHDTIQHRIPSSADRAHKSLCRLSQIISTVHAPQDPEHLFSGSEPILIFLFAHGFVHESQGNVASRSQPAL